MEDEKIVALYFARNENAIAETDRKYGAYLFTIAERILSCVPDSEECVNDTYMKTWQTVPPEKPSMLKHFLAKITRNLSLDRYKMKTAEKRGGGESDIVLSELAGCIPAEEAVETAIQGYIDGLLRIFLNDEEVGGLDEPLCIHDGDELTILRLVMLTGGFFR